MGTLFPEGSSEATLARDQSELAGGFYCVLCVCVWGGVKGDLGWLKKEFQLAEIKGGVLDGAAIDSAQVEALAKLPAREVLLAQLLGVINAPATKLLRTINEPGGSLARVIKAKSDKGE